LLGDYLKLLIAELKDTFINGYKERVGTYIEWKQILHWYKTNSLPSLTGKLYGFAIEYILWYTKSKEYTFNKSQRASYLNVFESQAGFYKCTDHPNEKDLGLVRQLIRTHSLPSDTVCDLFMGSGTTAVACKESDRNFIGCEINPHWVEVAYHRIKNCNKQGELL